MGGCRAYGVDWSMSWAIHKLDQVCAICARQYKLLTQRTALGAAGSGDYRRRRSREHGTNSVDSGQTLQARKVGT